MMNPVSMILLRTWSLMSPSYNLCGIWVKSDIGSPANFDAISLLSGINYSPFIRFYAFMLIKPYAALCCILSRKILIFGR